MKNANTGSPLSPSPSDEGAGKSGPLLQFRVLWHERIAGDMYPFAGRVYGKFSEAESELQGRREAYNFHWLMIEARAASDAAWPHALDEAPGI